MYWAAINLVVNEAAEERERDLALQARLIRNEIADMLDPKRG